MQKLSFVYQLNQYMNNIGTLYPIRWNCKTRKWYKHQPNWKILGVEPSLFVHVFLKLIALLLSPIALYTVIKNPGLIEPNYIPILGIIPLFTIIALIADDLTFEHCPEITFVLNWISNAQIFWPLTRKDTNFIWLTCAIVSLGVFIIAILFVVVIISLNIDPLYILEKFLFMKFLREKESDQYLDSFIFQMNRCMVIGFGGYFASTSMRNIGLLNYSIGIHRTKLLQILENWKLPTTNSIRFYRECQIVANIMRPVDYKQYTLLLSGLYLLFIVFVNILVFGIRKSSPLLLFVGLMFIVVCAICLSVTFLVGCSLFKSSCLILKNWRRSFELCIYSRFTQKMLRSLKVIAIPAGDAGIIDVSMKVNYLANLLLNVVNSIITIQSVVQS